MGESSYDEIAEWYDAWAGATIAGDSFFLVVEALMGDLADRRICDLACGQGRVARYLAEHGASVVGVDISAKMLDIARRYEQAESHGIDYLQADVRYLQVIPDSAYDGVICFTALMDIPDLVLTLNTASRILRPGGWFVFATLHPCFNTAHSGEMELSDGWARVIRGYFDAGYWRSDTRTGPPGKVGASHHTLSTYINTLIDAGLTLERAIEPRATTALAEARPISAEVPAVLVARGRKPSRDRSAVQALAATS